MKALVQNLELSRREIGQALFFYFWVAIVLAVILLSSDGSIACNPDAVSVFTNQRECRVVGHYPLGPRVP